MSIAKNTDLPTLLEHLGYSVVRKGRFHSTKEMDSLMIKNRTKWFRYSEQIGGDAITFLQHFHNMSFPDAVNSLLAFNGYSREAPIPIKPSIKEPPKEEKTEFILPTPSADNRRVYAYLRKRGISHQVIGAFLDSGLLYEDAVHHNCVFVGKDKSGKAVFAYKRGTYDGVNASCAHRFPSKDEPPNRFAASPFPHKSTPAATTFAGSPSGFKGDVPGSDKNVAFPLICDANKDTVHVFEAPIDLMSYMTLHRNMTSNAIALCCLHDGALQTYLTANPNIKSIMFCLDADKWGKAAADRIAEKYSAEGYSVSVDSPPKGKDWNEYLQIKNVRKHERSDER